MVSVVSPKVEGQWYISRKYMGWRRDVRRRTRGRTCCRCVRISR